MYNIKLRSELSRKMSTTTLKPRSNSHQFTQLANFSKSIQMAREELIKLVVYLTLTKASCMSVQLYKEECAEELNTDQCKYIGDTFSALLNVLNQQFLETSRFKRKEERSFLLLSTYVYCIEKGIEAAYNLRKKINKPIEFNETNIGTRIFGLDLCEEVKSQIISKTNQFEILMEEVYDVLKNDKLFKSKIKPYVFECMFWGALYTGIELCLRLDLK